MNHNCKQCSNKFEVTDDDLKFYEKISPVIGGVKYGIPKNLLDKPMRNIVKLIIQINYKYNEGNDCMGKWR